MVRVDAATKLSVVRGSQYRPPRGRSGALGDGDVLRTRHPLVTQALGDASHLEDVVDPSPPFPFGWVEAGVQVHHRCHDAQSQRCPPRSSDQQGDGRHDPHDDDDSPQQRSRQSAPEDATQLTSDDRARGQEPGHLP